MTARPYRPFDTRRFYGLNEVQADGRECIECRADFARSPDTGDAGRVQRHRLAGVRVCLAPAAGRPPRRRSDGGVVRTRARFHDPTGARYGIPTFWWRGAPAGLATRRQLRAAGLRPGGQDIAAQVMWRGVGGVRAAYLYRIDAGRAEADGQPGPARRDRQSADRPAHLPDLHAGQGLLHPALTG